MSINARRISKVIIAGQWFEVQMGTFQVVDMAFTDDAGTAQHDPLATKAYNFVSENGEYYGPLSSIELYKLVDM